MGIVFLFCMIVIQIYAKVVDVLPFFEAFYQNTPLSYENWEDVTKEFLEN